MSAVTVVSGPRGVRLGGSSCPGGGSLDLTALVGQVGRSVRPGEAGSRDLSALVGRVGRSVRPRGLGREVGSVLVGRVTGFVRPGRSGSRRSVCPGVSVSVGCPSASFSVGLSRGGSGHPMPRSGSGQPMSSWWIRSADVVRGLGRSSRATWGVVMGVGGEVGMKARRGLASGCGCRRRGPGLGQLLGGATGLFPRP